MPKFESTVSQRGNIGVSHVSQKLADAQVLAMDAANCYNCRNCTHCYNCRNCTHCRDCRDCRDCQGVLIWRGPQSTKLLAFNGLLWPIAVSKTHIQIGCQLHSIAEWDNFGDAEIDRMSPDALYFWRHNKALIMTIAETAQKGYDD